MLRLAITIAFLAIASVANAQAPCTHFVSQSGGGSGASVGSPMSFSAWWSAAQSSINSGGTPVGCIVDGTYGPLNPPNGVTGNANRPITVRALNDGQVTI